MLQNNTIKIKQRKKCKFGKIIGSNKQNSTSRNKITNALKLVEIGIKFEFS